MNEINPQLPGGEWIASTYVAFEGIYGVYPFSVGFSEIVIPRNKQVFELISECRHLHQAGL